MPEDGHVSESNPQFMIFFSLERWDHVWRRNQFICAGLLERYPALKILWINPPIDATANPNWINTFRSGAHAVPDMSRLWTLDLPKLLPNIVGINFNQTLYLKKIRRALHSLGVVNPIVWVNDQNSVTLVRALGWSVSVYDVTDDWAAASLSPRQRTAVITNDKWLVDNAQHVVVCSAHLRELKSAAKSLHLIPNGVDWRRYHPDNLANVRRPSELSLLTGPIVGYTGTLHEDRLDVDLICDLSTRVPNCNFVFVGPNCLSRKNDLRLRTYPNVNLIGAIPYSELPSYVAAFDICMTPHKVSEFTDSLDPLKLYEYLATGKPVVSTCCAGFRDFPELVQLCASAEDMAAAIGSIVATGGPKKLSAARLAYAANNGWSNRIMQFEALLRISKRTSLVMQ
ncbi:MAG TPA: glycosyltransferase [Candidatus Obscuribacterales bacterium]